MKPRMSSVQIARRISLGFFLTVTTILTILHQKLSAIPSIDAFCPFGGLETIYKFLASGELVKRIEPSNIALLVAVVLLGVILSRFFCGWICAFGALQGVFGWIGKKIFKRRFIVPAKLDGILRYLKYVVLAVVLFLSWQTASLFIRPYDPWAAYGHLSAGMESIMAEFLVGFIILVLTLVFSALFERAFCKYVCPLGAFNAILGRIPLFRIKREASTCTSCSKCNKVCSMNVDVMTAGTVSSPECIACMECVTSCPTGKNTLATFIAKKPVKMAVIIVVGLAIYAAAIATSMISKQFRATPVTLSEKAAGGEIKIEDIKGSSTWKEVADSFNVDLSTLFKAAGVDASKVPPDTKLKDTAKLAGLAEFEPDAARFALASMLGIPYAGEKGEAETAPVSSGSAPVAAEKPAAQEAPLVIPADFVLEGTMTLADVVKATGADEKAILDKLQLPSDFPKDKTFKEVKDQYGYSMPTLKERFK